MKTIQEQAAEMVERFGMDYTVEKEPLLLSKDQAETPFYALLRGDTRQPFGTVKKQYLAYQNMELMELALRLEEETNYSLDTARTYDNGARVEILLKTEESYLEYRNVGDIIKKGIALTNAHDGTGSLRLALKSEVLSCTNGMTKWVEDRKSSIRHTSNMKQMVEQAVRGFDIILEADKSFMSDVNRMNEAKVTATAINQIMQDIIGVDMRKVSSQWSSTEYSTRKVNLAKSLYDSIDEEMEYKGATMWGLLNGVTHYTTHKAGRDGSRESSKVFGDLMRKDQTAYNRILEMI